MIPTGIAEVGNGTATFEKQRATGNLIAIFNSYQLRKVERIMNERIGKEERVTDQKYAMVYYTRVRVMNQDYQLKVGFSFVKCIQALLSLHQRLIDTNHGRAKVFRGFFILLFFCRLYLYRYA